MWRDRVDDIETTLLPSLSNEGRAALFDRLRDLGEHPWAARFVRGRMGTVILWGERTVRSWRASPDQFGPWQAVYGRYHRRRPAGL